MILSGHNMYLTHICRHRRTLPLLITAMSPTWTPVPRTSTMPTPTVRASTMRDARGDHEGPRRLRSLSHQVGAVLAREACT